MSEEKNLIVTLDNNKKYAMVDNILFNGKKYIYLSELKDFKNIIIGEVIGDKLTVVNDSELFGQLIMEFNKSNS